MFKVYNEPRTKEAITKLGKHISFQSKWTYFLVVGGALLLLEFSHAYMSSPQIANLYPLAMVLLVSLLLPIIFETSKTHRFDRYLGEFSFPVYLIHIFILSLVASYWKQVAFLSGSSPEELTLMCMIIAVVVSYVIIACFIKPLDRLRHKLLRAQEPEAEGAALR